MKKRKSMVVRVLHRAGVVYQQELVACGKARCGKCGGTRPKHGPYWYAYLRGEAGKRISKYVGKIFRELAHG